MAIPKEGQYSWGKQGDFTRKLAPIQPNDPFCLTEALGVESIPLHDKRARIIECLHRAQMSNLAVLKAERTSGLMVAATVSGADRIRSNPKPEELAKMV